jgi:hypothetical protein
MKSTKRKAAPKKAQPQIRVTGPAHKHLADLVKARKKLGVPENLTSYVSELILKQPIPTQIRTLNQEAMQP